MKPYPVDLPVENYGELSIGYDDYLSSVRSRGATHITHTNGEKVRTNTIPFNTKNSYTLSLSYWFEEFIGFTQKWFPQKLKIYSSESVCSQNLQTCLFVCLLYCVIQARSFAKWIIKRKKFCGFKRCADEKCTN